MEMPEDTANLPPPAPPVGTKADIFDPEKFRDIDQRARKAPKELLLSFCDLVDYLTEGLPSDLAKLRSIFVWMGSQELMDTSCYPEDFPCTPYGFLKEITRNIFGSNVRFLFSRLCSQAGLQHQAVEGYTKQYTEFTVGDVSERPDCVWYMVLVDGSWRIVNTLLAFVGCTTVEDANWTLVEESGEAVQRQRVTASQLTVQRINENCFLPDPEDFIYFSLPADPKCQLLAKPWSKAKFFRTPVVTRHYLKSAWHLDDRTEAIVEAKDGRCSITFDQVPEGQKNVRYKLFYNENRSKKKFPDELQLDNYIKFTGGKNQLSLLTRLPQTGIYKLEIKDGDKIDLCELLIQSVGQTDKAKPFPPIPKAGLGFNQAAIDAGLVYPSREDGLVVAEEGEKVRFCFRTKKPLDIVTRLVHSTLPSQQLDSRVTYEEEDDLVTINVTIPWDSYNPEFSLQVDARARDSEEGEGHFVNVLNYLLTPDRQLVHSIKGKDKQVHDELVDAIADSDVHRMEKALWEFRLAHMKDDQLYNKICNRLCEQHQNAVESALGDEDRLSSALRDVDQSQVAYLLHQAPWMTPARHTLRRLKRLASMRHQVQSLRAKQVSEIQSYNHPDAGIKTAVIAAYILLGENEKKLKKWSYVQALLRQHGRRGIMQRIQTHTVSTVSTNQLTKAHSYLSNCTAEELHCKSVSAAALYNWSKAVIDAKQEKENSNDTDKEEKDEDEQEKDSKEQKDKEEQEQGQEKDSKEQNNKEEQEQGQEEESKENKENETNKPRHS